MSRPEALVGREAERASRRRAAPRPRGSGMLLLLRRGGSARPRLVDAAVTRACPSTLRGAAPRAARPPTARLWAPCVPTAGRARGPRRVWPAARAPRADPARARRHPRRRDRATLFEAVLCALAELAATAPSCSSSTTCTGPTRRRSSCCRARPALTTCRCSCRRLPLRRAPPRPPAAATARRAAPVGRDRRAHPRPARRVAAAALLTDVLDAQLSPALAATIHDRAQGLPFFVEELAGALRAGRLLRESPDGLMLAGDADLPVPATVRDAVLMRRRRRCRARRARPPRRPPSPASTSTSSSSRSCPARTASRSCSTAPWRASWRRPPAPSAMRSPATRSTPTSPGRAGARCTGCSPSASRRPARRTWRSRRTGSARTGGPRARRAAARGGVVLARPRLPRRRRPPAAGARVLANGDTVEGPRAPRRARALRGLRGAGRRPAEAARA